VLGTGKLGAGATTLLLVALAAFAIAGCGGGGGGGESKDEVAAKVEQACRKVNGYAVWLPEYQQKTHKSIDEITAVMHGADDEFRSTLEGLDPPNELTDAIAKIEAGNTQQGTKPAEVKAQLRKTAVLYEEIGATDCAKGVHAGLKTLDGAAVKDAYAEEGLALPPRPKGW
jgi:hypothetical protein